MAAKSIPLAEYVQTASPMAEYPLGKAAEGFIARLAMLESAGPVGPLLTPYNILVAEGRLALRRTRVGRQQAARLELYPGYTAPECYQGRRGEAAEVYFVGAVLCALLRGAPPEETGGRETDAPLLASLGPLGAVIQKALAPDPAERYGSLPLLLDAVRNALGKTSAEAAAVVPKAEAGAQGALIKEEAPALPGETPRPQERQKRPVRRVVRIVAALLAVVVLAGLALGIYSGVQSSRLAEAMGAQDHARIVEVMDGAPWLRGRFGRQYDYSRATLLLQKGRLEESAELFASLGDFGDSAQVSGQIEAYRQAQSKPTALARYEAFRDLGDFLDSRERAQALVDDVYREGLELYAQTNYSAAHKRFEAVAAYRQEALHYKALCGIAQQVPAMTEEKKLQAARQIADYERQYGIGVEGLLMWDELVEYFLHGTWYTGDGDAFTFDVTTRIYTLTGPTLPEHQLYYIRRGRFIGEVDKQTYVTIEYAGCDEITLHFTQGGTYILHRA